LWKQQQDRGKASLIATLLHERLSQEANFIKLQRPCLEAANHEKLGFAAPLLAERLGESFTSFIVSKSSL